MNRLLIVAAGAAMLTLATRVEAQDESRKVEDGGIQVQGWQGKIDPNEAAKGQVLANSKLAKSGDALQVTTGPAVVYWHPSNTATGNYTVKATFNEQKFQNLNNHAHPYGIFIAGNDMGTDKQSYLYCTAYGNGRFIVRGFGPDTTFRLNGRGEEHAAINKAAGPGQPVTQEIALSVKDDNIECAINGQVVGSYKKADAIGERKLKSTDGMYGIRFGHNTEATVTGLTVTKP
jgi:hypothetical protein